MRKSDNNKKLNQIWVLQMSSIMSILYAKLQEMQEFYNYKIKIELQNRFRYQKLDNMLVM